MIEAMRAWVERQGGLLVAPRDTLSELDEDEGRRDGTWALLAWLLAVHTYDLFAVAARVASLRNFDAVLGSAAELAFALLPPFVATFAIELVLGRARSYRAGTLLTPMIAVGALLRLAESTGLWLLRPGWAADVIAGVVAVGFAWVVRDAVAIRTAGDA